MRPKIFGAMLLAAAMTGPLHAQQLDEAIRADMPELMALYREFHANPELSMQERATAERMAAQARALGFTVTTGVGGTGVVAVLENGPGPVVMLRADMDALPVEEQTGLPFASRVRATSSAGVESGVMHACGHDTHMTAWVGAARRLVAMRDRWSGTLVMIGQPGEEVGLGAKAMLDDGLFTRFPRPSHVIAFHDSATLPAGIIGFTPGPALANVDSVDIQVRGQGGHGAAPHTTRDPIVLASRIVTSLQTLVSRELDPLDSAVVTVGSFHAGTKHNIISDEARLQLTVRSYTPEVRQMLLDGSQEGEDRWANLLELREVVTRYSDLDPEDALDRLLEETALVADQDTYEKDADAVTLITLHAAKGLEFDVVFISGLEEGVFPHSRALEDNRQMEEERRLAYVGLTRARERLYVSRAVKLVNQKGRLKSSLVFDEFPTLYFNGIDSLIATARRAVSWRSSVVA
mgnify:CR=1 FL=1